MKKIASLLLFLSICLGASAQTSIDVAFGTGAIAVGGNMGAFTFGFAQTGDRLWGGAAYAEVDPNGVPVVQVLMPMASGVTFGRGTVAAEGLGILQVGDRQIPVNVAIRGSATRTDAPGSFGIVCSIVGVPIYRAAGDLVAGRVAVRRLERR